MPKHTFGDAELREVITTWPEFALLNVSSTGIRETDQEWGLGHVGIFKEEPLASFGYVYDLTETARFDKVRFDFPDLAQHGWAAIFTLRAQPDDPDAQRRTARFAAWVTDDHEADLDEWIAFMNAHIDSLFTT